MQGEDFEVAPLAMNATIRQAGYRRNLKVTIQIRGESIFLQARPA